MTEQKQTTLTIRIDADLKRAAELVARDRDETLSMLVRKFLRDYIAKGAQADFLKDSKKK